MPKYARGKPNYFDSLWTFAPSEVAGQYTISCQNKPFGFLTYSSVIVGSGYHAAIIDDPANRPKMLRGGAWPKDALWKVKKTNEKKYFKLENVGFAKAELCWSLAKPNPTNYFIQLTSLDEGEDSKFRFQPSAFKLVGKISKFKFNRKPEDVFK